MGPKYQLSEADIQNHPSRSNKGMSDWAWLVLYCASITLIVCAFSWVATFNLLPEQALASGKSMLAANYSPWQGYEMLNLDIVRLATAAAQGDAPWQNGVFDTSTPQLPATAIQITSQVSPLPTLTSTVFVPTRRPALPSATNTQLPTDTATAIATTPPPPPPTSPLPTVPPPPTATDTATVTLTFTPTSTPTQILPPPEINLSEPADNDVFELCNGSIVIDLYDNPITVPGSSLRFYEEVEPYPVPPGGSDMYLGWVQIDICADVGCSTPYLIFYWGDGNAGNNGNLPSGYDPIEIQGEVFHGNKVGISINISGMPAGIYQFVRVTSPSGSDCGTDPDLNAQIDALIVE